MDEDDDSKIFPQRLMEILSEESNQEAICWLPHGRAFIVRNRKLFADMVMPKYFSRKAKYSSFARKLNRWNFVRVSSGPELGAYYHEFFLRDKPYLAAQMFCKNARTKLAMASDSPAVASAVATAIAAGANTGTASVEAATAAFAKASVSPQPSLSSESTNALCPVPDHVPSFSPCASHQQHQSTAIPQLPADVPLALLQQILSKGDPAPACASEPNGPTPSVILQQAHYAQMLVERQIQILQREQAKRMVLQSLHHDRVLDFQSNQANGLPQPQRLAQMQQLLDMQRQRKDNRPINSRASAA